MQEEPCPRCKGEGGWISLGPCEWVVCGVCTPKSTTPPCTLCGNPTDPDWYCSMGYCPECCEENDDGF